MDNIKLELVDLEFDYDGKHLVTKGVKCDAHGSYYLVIDNEFCCMPMCNDGSFDSDAVGGVEEAPDFFEDAHRLSLELLGYSKGDIDNFIKKVAYYEDDKANYEVKE